MEKRSLLNFLRTEPGRKLKEIYETECPFCDEGKFTVRDETYFCTGCAAQGDIIIYIMTRYLVDQDTACAIALGVNEPKNIKKPLQQYFEGCEPDKEELYGADHIMQYGKYKGTPIGKLPISYIKWLIESQKGKENKFIKSINKMMKDRGMIN